MKYGLRFLAMTFSLCVLAASQANAGLITENFDVEVVFGPGVGTMGTIDVTYDDTDLVTGNETLEQTQVTLALDIFSQMFGNGDDIDYPGFPRVEFTGGLITFIDYVISESSFFPGQNPRPIDDPAIAVIGGGDVENNVWFVSTEGPQIPEPAILTLMGLGLAGVGFARKRKRV